MRESLQYHAALLYVATKGLKEKRGAVLGE